MNLLPFYATQRKLDQEILDKHNLELTKDLTAKKVIAFKVELGELANEIRFFKYWSLKPSSKREVILEEWTDCFHFLLSIGNDRKFSRLVTMTNAEVYDENTLTEVFDKLFTLSFSTTAYFRIGMNCLFAIAKKLDFTEEELKDMYYKKNAKNYKRQEEGY